MADFNYLKFTGDYTALKGMGYKFQKLYANNYMSWSKNGVYIFKRGADITHGEFDLYKLVTFWRTNPKVRTHECGVSFFKFYNNPDTNDYDYYPYTDENIAKYRANLDEWGKWSEESGEDAPECMSSIMVGHDLLTQLEELNELGWYELAWPTEKVDG